MLRTLRLFSVVLALFFSATALSGCEKSAEEKEKGWWDCIYECCKKRGVKNCEDYDENRVTTELRYVNKGGQCLSACNYERDSTTFQRIKSYLPSF